MHRLMIFGCAAALVAASAAHGAGGPTPGILAGGQGVVSRSGAVRYVALPHAKSTTVAAVRVHGGQVLRSRVLGGSFGVQQVAFDGTTGGVSADGRALVLVSSVTGYPPATRFTVLRLPGLRPRMTITLRGVWAFDAISPRARTMYLIQIGRNGLSYDVRAYDLAVRRLITQPVVDRSEAGDPMRGSPMARVAGGGGRWAYTLYANGRKPFVHALDTVARRAVCVDLPSAGDRLALLGGRLIVLARGKTVAVVNTRTFRVQPEGAGDR